MSREEYRNYFDAVKHACPDVNTVCYDIATGKGSLGKTVIFTRYVKLGRFAGTPLYGFNPTHMRIEERGIAFVRFNNQNKIEYMEIYPNDFELLSYMGLNLYNKLPSTATSLTGPQGLLARELLGPTYNRTGLAGSVANTTESLMAHLPPKVTESFNLLRENINEAASSGKEELVHLSNKLRDLFSSYTGSGTSGTTSSSTTTTSTSRNM